MNRLPRAKEIMVTNLVTMTPEDDVLRGIRVLLDNRITGAPVVDSHRHYFGVLSESSCMRVLYLTAKEVGVKETEAPPARQFMTTKLLTLKPETDALDAVAMLLKHRFSGAPVVDEDQNFLGVFSERYIMRLLIATAYEQVPSPQVGAYLNADRGRLIDENTDLLEVARMFLDTYYRRLEVLKDGKLVGQISRRDVLTAEHHLSRFVKGRRKALLDNRREPELAEVWNRDGTLPSTKVSRFMDTTADTIEENLDFLGISQIFLNTNRRRLPVLRDGKLVGQVSRRDLLLEVLRLLEHRPKRAQPGLYLSAILKPNQNPTLSAAQSRIKGKPLPIAHRPLRDE